ncbi:MAG: VWA-like domain-containing protein [Xanthomonadales bacterium]|nr:VWA-like domain-containing protein [Xanthomonadales bacterium]
MSDAARIVQARNLTDAERQSKRDILPVLERDRVQLMLSQPFLGSLAMRLEMVPVVDCRLPTAATDGERLFFNALFMSNLDADTRHFIVAHEVWHCAALHFPRRGERDPKIWNLAIDHETNHVLGQQGLTIPQGAVHYARHAGDNAETVYAALESNKCRQERSASLADEHDPVGSLNLPVSGAVDPDYVPLESAETWKKWPARVNVAAQQLRRLHGHLPGYVRNLLELVGEPTVPWQEILRRFVERSHASEYHWTRPNRRYITQGLFLPGRHSEQLSLAVALDISGSVFGDLHRFMAELKGILDSFTHWRLRLLACDTRVVFDRVYTDQSPPPQRLPISAGGGTDLQPVFDALADEPPTALIYLTDGYADQPSRPEFPVLWAIPPDGQRPVEWGELIELPPS